MQYYNAKDKFIMKRAGADIFGHSHGGATEWAYEPLGGASRRSRSRSRRGGAMQPRKYFKLFDDMLGGGKRPFIKRTCRSKSRCGGAGAANYRQPVALGGSRGVRRSRRGGGRVLAYDDMNFLHLA
jgi:DnaJ-class molecular chaperone